MTTTDSTTAPDAFDALIDAARAGDTGAQVFYTCAMMWAFVYAPEPILPATAHRFRADAASRLARAGVARHRGAMVLLGVDIAFSLPDAIAEAFPLSCDESLTSIE